MKKLTALLAIAMLTTQLVGCGLFGRVRDHFCRGAFCGQSAVVGPVISRPPATVIAPQPAIVVPQASVVSGCDPCVTCSPVCEPCCDSGLSYPSGVGFIESSGSATFSGSGTRSQEGLVLPGPVN